MARIVWIAALCVAVVGGAREARAEDGFIVCNRTNLTVVFAKALNVSDKAKKEPNRVVSEGWFTLAPAACTNAYPGKLKYRYYLIYAEAKASNRKWTGEFSVCVEEKNFTLSGDLCRGSRNSRKFAQVDTGDYNTYTYDLK